MTIRLIVTREGEQIIAGIKEWMSGPGPERFKVIGYILTRPCLVDLDMDPENEDNFRVRMVPWIPLSKDMNVPIPADYVVTMLTPISKVSDLYDRDIVNASEEDLSLDESHTFIEDEPEDNYIDDPASVEEEYIIDPPPEGEYVTEEATDVPEGHSMIKVILLTSNAVLISEIEEVGADIGEPDCKLINPYVINQSSLIQWKSWLLNITTQSEFMISSDKILTISDPTEELTKKYNSLVK